MSIGQILSYIFYSEKFKDLEGLSFRRNRRSNPPAAAAQIAQVAPPVIQATSLTISVPSPSPAPTQRVYPAAVQNVEIGKVPLTEIEDLIELANNNDPAACYMLYEYYKTIHKKTNDSLALDWLDRAASLNYPKALSTKGQMLQTGFKYKLDPARGALYLKKAAAQSKQQP
ncbi:MAG: hypothetical protein LLG04_09635 [Parachlamydia sp.]|nr:hypothetical protein [Parachlamydia sp.]